MHATLQAAVDVKLLNLAKLWIPPFRTQLMDLTQNCKDAHNSDNITQNLWFYKKQRTSTFIRKVRHANTYKQTQSCQSCPIHCHSHQNISNCSKHNPKRANNTQTPEYDTKRIRRQCKPSKQCEIYQTTPKTPKHAKNVKNDEKYVKQHKHSHTPPKL